MRVAELEDKLAKVYITEDEMKAYHKVASSLGTAPSAGAGAAAAGPVVNPQLCSIHQPCVISQCIQHCIISQCIRSQCIISQCIRECSCGPCILGGGGGGGGFGTLGG
jgi:hypothetical protein